MLGDGHVGVRWQAGRSGAGAAATPPAPPDLCQKLGYDAKKSGRVLGPHIPGYRPLPDLEAPEFPAGLLAVARQRVGILRIGLFGPQGSPELCAAALRTLKIERDAACDAQGADRVESAAYTIMSHDLATRIRALRRRGATTLLIDLTRNGGGSEWAEAAARIVSPLRLRSERLDFVRGAHWAEHWEALAHELRGAEASVSPADRDTIERWLPEIERLKTVATTPCPAEPFWTGRRPDCEWLGRGLYATGILGEADAATLRKKPWGPLAFSPAQYDFEEAVWHGPLLVLVDENTGSAAEEFAAVLQDNKAAVVIGAPTAGAGCGHTNGGTPTRLKNSRAILELPDCARIRRDGSNEVRGIDPDILIGFRPTDGMQRKGLRLAAALSRGVEAAGRLCQRERCDRRASRTPSTSR
jgi:hypothetical protein